MLTSTSVVLSLTMVMLNTEAILGSPVIVVLLALMNTL